MALQTMAELKPEFAEHHAFEFWDRGKYLAGSSEDEYRKNHGVACIGEAQLTEIRSVSGAGEAIGL